MNIIGFIKVWSLVGGRVVLEVLSLITIWHAIDWRPSYKFDKKAALELISYGKHVMAANVAVFFISVIDVMFIASLLTAQVSDLLGQVIVPCLFQDSG